MDLREAESSWRRNDSEAREQDCEEARQKGKKKAAPVARTVVGPCIDLITAGELVQRQMYRRTSCRSDTTLEDAGLISAGQRAHFRSDVVEKVSARGCTIDADAVPNSASTTLRNVPNRGSAERPLITLEGSTMRLRILVTCGLAALSMASPALAQPAKDTLWYKLVSATISANTAACRLHRHRVRPDHPHAVSHGRQHRAADRHRVDDRDARTSQPCKSADRGCHRSVRGRRPRTQPPRRREARNAAGSCNTPGTRAAAGRKLSRRDRGQPRKAGASGFYGTSKGKDDADIYFKGLAVGTTGSKPAYRSTRSSRISERSARTRVVGGATTYNVDKASDIGPDTITVTTAYSKVFVWNAATGLILDVDPAGLELDSKNDTRNFRSAGRGRFVVPSAKVGAQSYMTGDLTLGYEAGRTERGDASATGIWRTLVGAGGYALLQGGSVVKRIDITASWVMRLLRPGRADDEARRWRLEHDTDR